jgi:YD repeat-containing protein
MIKQTIQALVVGTIALSLSSYAFAGKTTTYRDSKGRITGSSSTSGKTTTYRDSKGRITGTARRN